jgi:hypothetical protein
MTAPPSRPGMFSGERYYPPFAAARILPLALLFGATVQRMVTCCTVHCNNINDLAVVTRGFAFEAQYLVARRRPE